MYRIYYHGPNGRIYVDYPMSYTSAKVFARENASAMPAIIFFVVAENDLNTPIYSVYTMGIGGNFIESRVD